MMRPATPLAILFFVAFALLLLSSISVPVIKAIPIASHKGYKFGVWGFCEGDSCSKIGIGYDMNNFNGITADDFSLPAGTRNSLSPILVIHPVAAFLALICTILAIAAHFHSPAHSPRFLLGLFILTIPTLICSLLAFIVDILIFIPHVAWGGWVVVAATVIIAVAGLVTCGMRRSLVSRKARRKRIQENAEMNGQNYFDTMGQKQEGMGNTIAVSSVVSDLPRAESPPPLTGESSVPLNDKSGSSFGTYTSTPSQEDKQPLRMNNEPPGMGGAPVYGAPRPRNNSIPRQVDQFGNPAVPMMAMGRPSMESNRSNGANRNDPRLYGAPGGQGGYPQNQRGGFPQRGGPMMRGGPIRGGYRGRGGPNMGPRPQGGPPSGYGASDPYAQSNYEQGQRGISPAYAQDRRGMSPAGMGRQIMPQEAAIGQAMEMDANTGVPSPALSPVNAVAPDDYSQPRHLWSAQPPRDRNGNRALSPIQASPIDSQSKYSQTQVAPMSTALPRGNTHARSASGSYYEDVEPRFAPEEPIAQQPPPTAMTASSQAIPSLLLPNNPNARGAPQNFDQQAPPIPFDMRQESQESMQEGQRSPATSDTSHFTSVSQRGVNPRWPGLGQQHPSMARGGPPPPNMHMQHPRATDVVLNANPDFMIPGVGPRARGGGPPRGPGRQSPGMSGGLGQPSRYPMS